MLAIFAPISAESKRDARAASRPNPAYLQIDSLIAGLRRPVNSGHNEVEAVRIVQHGHVEGVVTVPSSLEPRMWMLAWLVRARYPVIHSEMKVQSDGHRKLAPEPPIRHL